MRERITLLRGRVAVESSEGSGTVVVVEVPIR
jgi:signal transduction histidine kinase